MSDWRVVFLSTASFLVILTGLVALALPDPYEGVVLYTFDADHAVRILDLIGLLLLGLGGALAWSAALIWQRRVSP